MKTSSKIGISVSALFAVFFFAITLVLSNLAGTMQATAAQSIPSGSLSNSIFDSQNMKYVADPSLPVTTNFETIPYSVDLPKVDAASVGDHGRVYKVLEDTYIYTSEFKNSNGTTDNVLPEELGKALKIDYVASLTNLRDAVSEKGFLDGFEASYKVYDMAVMADAGGSDKVPATVMAYSFNVPDYDSTLVISIAKRKPLSEVTNEELIQLKQILDTLSHTLQFSKELEESLKDAAEKAAAEASESAEAENAAREEAEKTSETSASTSEAGNAKNMAVTIDKDYGSLELILYWENSTVTPNFTIYNADKSVSYSPVSSENGEAKFSMGRVSASKMILEITGENYGKISMSLTEKASTGNSNSEAYYEEKRPSADDYNGEYDGYDADAEEEEDDNSDIGFDSDEEESDEENSNEDSNDWASSTTAAATVPNVVGLSRDVATNKLSEAGFGVKVKKQSSSTVDTGYVISQTPAADGASIPGSDVTIVVSEGNTDTVYVPNVENLSRDKASEVLTGAGFSVKVMKKSSDTVDEGYVMAQKPEAGEMLESGSEVKILVSTGKD